MSTDANNNSTVDNVSIDNIDDFLPMPGAESIVTSDEEDDNKWNIIHDIVKGFPMTNM